MAVDATHPHCFEADGWLWVSAAPEEQTRLAQAELSRSRRRAALALVIGRAAGMGIGVVAGVLISSAVLGSSTRFLVGIALGAIVGFLLGGALGAMIERRIHGPVSATAFPPRMLVPPEVAATAPWDSTVEQIRRWSGAVNAYRADAGKVPDQGRPVTTNKYAKTPEAMHELALRLAQERQDYMKVAAELGFPPEPAPPGLGEVES